MSSKIREDIQGLRAVAIIMVLLFHFFPSQFPNGYVGVDMFFVISGYIISMVYPKGANLEKLAQFYYRRVKRILPLYFFTILFVLILAVLFAPRSFMEPNLITAKRAILLISNVINGQSAQLNYQLLIAHAKDLFVHCWSLCLEMQWYLLAPVIFFFQSSRIRFCQVILLLSVIFHIFTDESTAFNSVFARLWQFVAGVLADQFTQHSSLEEGEEEEICLIDDFPSNNKIAILRPLTSLHFFTLLIGFLPSVQNPTDLRLLVTAATSALLLSGSTCQVSFLSSPILTWIGNISYSLYLVHWPIYVVAKTSQFPRGIPIGLAASVLLAAAVYYLFEQQYLQWEKMTILILVGFLFASSLGVSINGVAIRKWVYSEKDLQDLIEERRETMPWLAMNIAEGGIENYRKNLGNPLCKYGNLFGIKMGPPFGHCEMPNGNGSQNILVIGNSWASNQGPTLIYNNFMPFAKKFDVLGVAVCEPLHHTPHENCKNVPNYGRLAVDHFKPDVLFILQRAMTTCDPINGTDIDKDPIFSESLGNLQYFEQRVKKIYIQQALPWALTTPAVEAMIKENKTMAELGDKLVQRDEKFARIRIDELAKRCKNCTLIDYLPYFPVGSNGLHVP